MNYPGYVVDDGSVPICSLHRGAGGGSVAGLCDPRMDWSDFGAWPEAVAELYAVLAGSGTG